MGAPGLEPGTNDYVIETIKELRIPLIDISEDLMNNHNDPLSIFPFKIDYDYLNTYNAKGYSIVANSINNKIKGIDIRK